MILESDIEQYFKKQVERRGALVWKFSSPNQAGVPDRIVLMPGGQVAFAEIKAPGKKPRPLQQAIFEKMARLDFPVWVIDSYADTDDFIEYYVVQGCLT